MPISGKGSGEAAVTDVTRELISTRHRPSERVRHACVACHTHTLSFVLSLSLSLAPCLSISHSTLSFFMSLSPSPAFFFFLSLSLSLHLSSPEVLTEKRSLRHDM